jgi:hypothetical protein
MGRPNYVCTTCSEHFTRKYSAKRHNITVHHNHNGGEIVPLVEYLVGRKSGRYQASHSFWYRRNGKPIHKLGRPTVADYVGDTFRTGGLQRQEQGQYQKQYQCSLEEQERYHRQQQQSLSPSIPPAPAGIQDQPPDVPYPTEYQSQSLNTTDDEETTTLSRETILKIEELKRLMYRYSQYHRNPSAILNCIVYYCNNGDNTLLDEKLQQLRMLDSAMGCPGM